MQTHIRLASPRHPARLLLFIAPVAIAGTALACAWLFAPRPTAAVPTVPAAARAPAPAAAMPAPSGVLVHITGAVAHPGLYRVPRGERVYAAIDAAGGLTAAADQSRLPDMAATVRDGGQIKVPSTTTPGTGSSSRTARVHLNQATAAELEGVPGFTPDLAAAAVQYRTTYGDFTSIRDLVTVLGMSDADYMLARARLAL
jgi:competence protein ComEA